MSGLNSSQPDEYSPACVGWPAVHHRLFQLAHFAFLAAFLVPHTFRLSAAAMRALLTAGLALEASWAVVRVCAPDILSWCICLMLVNVLHSLHQLWLAWPERPPPELRDLYRRLFAPFRVRPHEFALLARAGEIRRLTKGEVFAAENITPTGGRLAVLLTGELVVTCDGSCLHHVTPHQFVSSPEWEAHQMTSHSHSGVPNGVPGVPNGVSVDGEVANHKPKPSDGEPVYQVSIVALKESTYVSWDPDPLQAVLQDNVFLNSVIFNVVGKDITQKLYQVNEYLRCEDRRRSGQAAGPGTHRSSSVDDMLSGSRRIARSHGWLGDTRRRLSTGTLPEAAQVLSPGRLLGARLPPVVPRRPAPWRIYPVPASGYKSSPFYAEMAAYGPHRMPHRVRLAHSLARRK